ncbi:LysM peptidoglycan-binding domain-containing protein [Undibacterium pigrum]|uniref:LysM domain-containing protein n=1 Tax=Undibacterium pigrum TaxID=401470 RepID=A0A318IW78_9BURK|nr:LysM peptidoglycan-binding domain-containing protein [Undibacterium pigrum]PXX33941.1 hypothetical protein DFR42_12720 [Undibacterium pigrum]
MPNSSIRGRDGLYYRISDFDDLDGYDDFNAQNSARDMADDLQLSDLDPSIRLLPSGTAMGRIGNGEDSYRLSSFDDVSSRFVPSSTGIRLMTGSGIPMTKAEGLGREYLQASTPARSWLLNPMSDERAADSDAFSAPNLAKPSSGLLSKFDSSTPQEYRLGVINSDELQEDNSIYTPHISPFSAAKEASYDRVNLVPDYFLGEDLTERIRPEDDGSPNRWRDIPAMTHEEVARGVNIPVKIDDLLGNVADLRFAPRTYTVKRGDNPAVIGKQFFNDERAGRSILAQNGLATSVDGARNLPVGRVLTIPDNITNASLRAGGQLIAADASLRQQTAELARRQQAIKSNSQVEDENGNRQLTGNTDLPIRIVNDAFPGISPAAAQTYQSILTGDAEAKVGVPAGVKYINAAKGFGPLVIDETRMHVKDFGRVSPHEIFTGLVNKGLNNYLGYQPYTEMSNFKVRDMGPVRVGQIYDVDIWPKGWFDNGTVVLTKWENNPKTGLPSIRLSTTDTRGASNKSDDVTGEHAVSGGREISVEVNPNGGFDIVNRGLSRSTRSWVSDGEFLLDISKFRDEGGAQNANWQRFMQGLANKIKENGGNIGEKEATIYHYPNSPTDSDVAVQPGVKPKFIHRERF